VAGSVGKEAADGAADGERKAPSATEAADRAAESVAATVEGMGGEAASTAACGGVEDTSDLEHLLHTETLLSGPSDRSTNYYHMPWHSLHRPRYVCLSLAPSHVIPCSASPVTSTPLERVNDQSGRLLFKWFNTDLRDSPNEPTR